MLWFFKRGKNSKQPDHANPTTGQGKVQSLIAAKPELLLKSHYGLIENLYSFSQLDRARFDRLYIALFINIARYVQLLPASEQHHHAYLGGLLEHTIEVATFAGRIAGKFLYTSDGEERISESSALYVFAMVSAAAMHDVGKILTDIDVVVIKGNNKIRWLPHNGPMAVGDRYIFKFSNNRIHGLHEPAGMLLAFSIMPPSAMEWIWQKPIIRNEWIATVGGKAMEAGGNIGRCVIECDAASTGINMKNAPVVKAAEAQEMTIGTRLPLQQLALKGIKLAFRDFPPNTERNPYWVSQEFVACICPRFVETVRGALGVEAQFLPENSSLIYDAMGDAGMLIPNLTNKAVHSILFSEKSKPLAAILLKREVIDPDKSLPVYMGKLFCPSMPENLHHNVPGRTESIGTATTQAAPTQTTQAAHEPTIITTKQEPVITAAKQTSMVANEQKPRNGELPPPPFKQRNNKHNKPLTAKADTVEPIIAQQQSNETGCNDEPENHNYELTVPVNNQNDFKEYMHRASVVVPDDEPRIATHAHHDVSTNLTAIPQNMATPNTEKPAERYQQADANSELSIGDRAVKAKSFFEWLRAQVLSGNLVINARGGELHVVDGHRLAMVTPAIFTKYLTALTNKQQIESGELREQTKTLQHALLENYKFAKSFSGSNMVKCELVGARSRHVIHVMILSDADSQSLNLELDKRSKNTFLSLSEPC